MNPRVRAMYKQFLVLGQDHPAKPMLKFREEVKGHFLRNKGAAGDELKRALAWGRYNLKELEALIHIHKFRAMRKYDVRPR
jgi:hypothetical protein